MVEKFRIRCVVVDDIDFTPMLAQAAIIDVEPTDEVADLIKELRKEETTLQRYGSSSFFVLRILKPVNPAAAGASASASASTSEIKKKLRGTGENLSLDPILQRLRERTMEAKRTELANEYVKILSAESEIQEYFTHEEKGLISAIVVRLTTPEEKVEKDIIRPLESGMTWRRRNLLGIVGESPPSETSGHHGTNLRAYALMDRPADRYTFPVALFDQRLALLQHRLENLDIPLGSDEAERLFPNEVESYNAADDFINVAIKDYSSEQARLEASKPFLLEIFGDDLVLQYEVARIGRSEKKSIKGNASTAKFDGAYVTTIETDIDEPRITRVIFEWKKSVHEGDPLSQMTKGYSEEVYGFKDKSYFESTHFPKIFVALSGHMLEISIAVCLETVVVNEILSLNLRDNLFRSELKQKLARVAVALQECSNTLHTYYSQLTGEGKRSSYFPSPTFVPVVSGPLMKGAFDASPTFPGLKILGHLSREGGLMGPKSTLRPSDMRHNLFLATLLGGNEAPARVVVKLVKRYNKEAHEHLANKGLAPKLFLCQRVIGNLIAVVMEHVTGSPLNEVLLTADSQLSVFKSLKRAIEALESEELVHGDLRAPNIMVDSDNTAKVIDFDWAAKHNKGLYPDKINTNQLYAQWHGDVGPMKKMKLEHDRFAVFKILMPKFLRDVPITEMPADER